VERYVDVVIARATWISRRNRSRVDAGGELRRQDFHDDASSEDAVDGNEDATHAATYELTIELIVGS
jgi:hypothetical protein